MFFASTIIVGLLSRIISKTIISASNGVLHNVIHFVSENSVFIELAMLLDNVIATKMYLEDIINSPIEKALMNFKTAIDHMVSISHVPSDSIKYVSPDSVSCIPPDSVKYFNEAIKNCVEAMSLKNTKITNYIIAMEIKLISQLCTENILGVSRNVKRMLLSFSQRSDVREMYQDLAYVGYTWEDHQMKNAHTLYKMCKFLRENKIIDEKTLKELDFKVRRGEYHPLVGENGEWPLTTSIADPVVRYRTTSDKAISATGQVGLGIVTVPLAFTFGALKTSFFTALAPILVPAMGIASLVQSDKHTSSEDLFKYKMEYYWRNHVCAIVTAPKDMIGLAMDEGHGSRGFFEKNPDKEEHTTK